MGNMFSGVTKLPECVGDARNGSRKKLFFDIFEVFHFWHLESQIRARSGDFRDFEGSAAGIDHDMSMLGVPDI